MDHLFQIRSVGEVEEPMLEGMTALGYMAAHTQRARLGLMVGAVPYRQPGLWLKATTTLDVLSGGRAWFGIGAAWNVEEARSLGIPFPELPDRFRLLEDTLRMAVARHGRATGHDGGSFQGKVVRAGRLLNSPQILSRPRVPIMVGGGGERTTLRLVARYADACNVFGAPDMLRHKFEVLREHCEDVGRDYDAIEKTNLSTISITPDGSKGSLTPARLGRPPRQLGRGGLAPHDLLGPRRGRHLEARADRPRCHPAGALAGRAVATRLIPQGSMQCC